MNIKKIIKLITISITAMIVFSGCANTQYQSDENVKRSIVILIKKVERLEELQGLNPKKTKRDERGDSMAIHPLVLSAKSKSIILKRKISVFSKRSKKSKIIATMRRGTKVKISTCDKYGWCTLKGQRGFIRKWKALN